MRRPVYGEDCRRAVRVSLLFHDVFDTKRAKNLYRGDLATGDLLSAPSSALNPFAGAIRDRNEVTDWPATSQDQIELAFTSSDNLVKEVPLSL